MINLEELISCFDSRFVNKAITELSWYKKHFNQGFLGFLVIWKINLTCPPFFSWNCHEKREGIIITRRRHDRLPLWKRLLVLGLWLPWHLKSQCICTPRNLFKRKGKPKNKSDKESEERWLDPVTNVYSCFDARGKFERTIPCIPSSQECETDPLTIFYLAGTCHEKLEEIFKDHLEEITVDF